MNIQTATPPAAKEFAARFEALRTELTRVFVGHDELLELLLSALIADGHVLLEGVPGLGKTLLARSLAGCLALHFSRIQFTPDLMPMDLIGGQQLFENGASSVILKFVPGPLHANFILADEINRATPKTQSALLEAMQEHQITSGCETFSLPQPFFVIATQNPIEQEGTYPLPEAQLDRFMFKLQVSYPSRSEEHAVVERMAHPVPPESAFAVAKLDDILRARELVDKIYIDDKIIEYILDIVIATRPGCQAGLSNRQSGANLRELEGLISFGASPRASIALALASRGMALLQGRAYVLPQDVKELAPDVLRHRIVLSYEAEAENIDADAVIGRLLSELRTP